MFKGRHQSCSENPAIEGSSFLPLNASIIAYLYLSDGSLPDTVHGIFSSFVRHVLSRYLYEKVGKRNTNFRVVSLDNLPRKVQGAFNEMCRLAFKGTAQNKVTFSHSDIEAVKDSAVICEMGLLQATPSILSEGQTVYYNFIHLSVQEFLSAVYISMLVTVKLLDGRSVRKHFDQLISRVESHETGPEVDCENLDPPQNQDDELPQITSSPNVGVQTTSPETEDTEQPQSSGSGTRTQAVILSQKTGKLTLCLQCRDVLIVSETHRTDSVTMLVNFVICASIWSCKLRREECNVCY